MAELDPLGGKERPGRRDGLAEGGGHRAEHGVGRGSQEPQSPPGKAEAGRVARVVAKASPATLPTHLLQQGKGYPGRVLAVSNDHSRETVVSHVDVAQIF